MLISLDRNELVTILECIELGCQAERGLKGYSEAHAHEYESLQEYLKLKKKLMSELSAY